MELEQKTFTVYKAM